MRRQYLFALCGRLCLVCNSCHLALDFIHQRTFVLSDLIRTVLEYHAGQAVQRGRPLSPCLHGENGLRRQGKEIDRGVHERPCRFRSVRWGAERVFQLQALTT